MRKLNYLSILLIGALIIVFAVGTYKEKVRESELSILAAEYHSEQESKQEKLKLELQQQILDEFPGIVAWGDSLTEGGGGNGVTFPNVLQGLISESKLDIPVENMGVAGEDTNTILGRVESVPFVVGSFTIPEDTSEVEIWLTSSNGNAVWPLRQGDKMNPVIINGVEGTIRIEQDSVDSADFTYYFQRTSAGESVEVEEETVVETIGSSSFDNYIPIIFIGTNGGYDDEEDLITQINTIRDMGKYNEKYIVLGLTTGNAESNEYLESLMEEEFGERYINLREYLVENGLELAGLEATEADLDAISEGSIPPSLLSDEVQFNAQGYTIIGQAIYERMNELGDFDKVRKLVRELKSLK